MKPANDQTTRAIEIKLKLVNENNDHSHWRNRQRRARAQHHQVALHLAASGMKTPELPCLVTITRLSRGTLDDDGAVSSAKFVRDAVARWIGVDDKLRCLVRYEVRQEKANGFGLRIQFAPMAVTPESMEAFRAATSAMPVRAKPAKKASSK